VLTLLDVIVDLKNLDSAPTKASNSGREMELDSDHQYRLVY
jgi:hypothetical protein